MRTEHATVAAMVLAALCWGCSSGPSAQTDASSTAHLDLSLDAGSTYAAYMKAVTAGTEEAGGGIPQAYWADGIRALNPVKVYIHRVNIVVVQRMNEGMEEGKYISNPLSSFIPMTDVDGFVFVNHAGSDYGVVGFKRAIGM